MHYAPATAAAGGESELHIHTAPAPALMGHRCHIRPSVLQERSRTHTRPDTRTRTRSVADGLPRRPADKELGPPAA